MNDFFIEKVNNLHKNLDKPIENAMNQYIKFVKKTNKTIIIQRNQLKSTQTNIY